MKFYPYKKRGGTEKVLAMLKGGTSSLGLVLTWELEVLAILKGAKSFHPLKGGGETSFGPLFSHFVAPPPHNE